MFKAAVILSGLVLYALGVASIPREFNQIKPGLRIVEGERASIKNFPYQISIQTYGGHSCGGTLIAPNKVLTAAHCLRDIPVKELKIRAGSTYHNRGGSLVDVSHYKVHSEFDSKTKFNDIALIFLGSPLTLDDDIKTIELATTEPKDGTPAVVSGWGTESFYKKDAAPEYLKSANLNIVSRENCMSEKYAYGKSRIFPSMICAAGDGADSCQGDSGGPLVIAGKLAGVISWGFGCAETMFPGVYSSVPAFLEWIKSNA